MNQTGCIVWPYKWKFSPMSSLTKVPVTDGWKMVKATASRGMFDWSRFTEGKTALWVTLPSTEVEMVRDPHTNRITGISYMVIADRDLEYDRRGTQSHATAHIQRVEEALKKGIPIYAFHVEGEHDEAGVWRLKSADMTRLYRMDHWQRIPGTQITVTAVFVPWNKTVLDL